MLDQSETRGIGCFSSCQQEDVRRREGGRLNEDRVCVCVCVLVFWGFFFWHGACDCCCWGFVFLHFTPSPLFSPASSAASQTGVNTASTVGIHWMTRLSCTNFTQQIRCLPCKTLIPNASPLPKIPKLFNSVPPCKQPPCWVRMPPHLRVASSCGAEAAVCA